MATSPAQSIASLSLSARLWRLKSITINIEELEMIFFYYYIISLTFHKKIRRLVYSQIRISVSRDPRPPTLVNLNA